MIRDICVIALVGYVVAAPPGSMFAAGHEHRVFRARADLSMLHGIAEQWRAQHGRLPCDTFLSAVALGLTDPWGRPYRYERHDGGVKFVTFGRDGEPGGEGWDEDFETWLITCESATAPDTCRVCAEP